MTEKYYVIYANEDGEVRLSVHTKSDLLKKLDEQNWGTNYIARSDQFDLSSISGVIIIKGQQIIPQPKQVVESWDIE
jgi:hypothetical protein